MIMFFPLQLLTKKVLLLNQIKKTHTNYAQGWQEGMIFSAQLLPEKVINLNKSMKHITPKHKDGKSWLGF